MKKLFLFFSLVLFYFISFSQKHDNNWLIGYLNFNNQNPKTGRAIISFNDTFAVAVDSTLADLYLIGCDVVFSDSTGKKILFYSSGLDLYNSQDELLENGDTLAPTSYWNYYKEKVKSSSCPGGMLSLPVYYKDSLVIYFFHSGIGDVGANIKTRTSLWLTKIVFDDQHPLGYAKIKNLLLLDSMLLENPKAVKHANGKDWWIVIGENFSGRNYCYLLKNGQLQTPKIFDFNEKIDYWSNSESIFTPDGSKFVRHSLLGIIIYDFDRCTGEISNPNVCLYPNEQTFGAGTIISSNSEWLYLTTSKILWQVHLNSFPYTIDTAAILIVNNQGFPTNMSIGELGPDGKIYIITGSTTPFIHVINDPDKGCPNCNFISNALNVKSYNGIFGLPSFPNYRLGPLIGINCDSITYTSNPTRIEGIKIFPNPAFNTIRLEYLGPSGFQKEMKLDLINISGRVLLSEPLPIFSIYRDVDISNLAPGLYIWQIKDDKEVLKSGKFVIIR